MRRREGTWNLKNHRDPTTVASEVEATLREHRLDIFHVQEAGQYDKALARIPGYVYRTTRGGLLSQRDSGILIRNGIQHRQQRSHSLGSVWKRTKAPGMHPGRSITPVLIEGVRHFSVHMPPSPGINQAAWRSTWRTLRRLLRFSRWRILAPGDWNMPPSRVGAFTIRRLARATRCTIHGTGIDYILARGVYVTNVRRGNKRGSDHAPVLYDTEPKPARLRARTWNPWRKK